MAEYYEDARYEQRAWERKSRRRGFEMEQRAAHAMEDGHPREDPVKHLWTKAKSRAAQLGIPFTISEADVVMPECCPYLGIQLVCLEGVGAIDNTATIDRIDNDMGYVPGNVEVISRLANTMKNKASLHLLVRFARAVVEKFDTPRGTS